MHPSLGSQVANPSTANCGCTWLFQSCWDNHPLQLSRNVLQEWCPLSAFLALWKRTSAELLLVLYLCSLILGLWWWSFCSLLMCVTLINRLNLVFAFIRFGFFFVLICFICFNLLVACWRTPWWRSVTLKLINPREVDWILNWKTSKCAKHWVERQKPWHT